MRHLFWVIRGRLRSHRELMGAVPSALIAVALAATEQSIIALCFAIFMIAIQAVMTDRYREAFSSAYGEIDDKLTDIEDDVEILSRLAQEREAELSALKKDLKHLAVESRWALDDYRNALSRDECVDWSATSELEFLIRNIEFLVDTGRSSLTEPVQISDLLSPEELEKFYSDTEKEVNTTTAEEE